MVESLDTFFPIPALPFSFYSSSAVAFSIHHLPCESSSPYPAFSSLPSSPSSSASEIMARGAIPDKWSMRILWACALGSAVGLYMVAVDRQMKNRENMLAEALKAEAEGSGGSA